MKESRPVYRVTLDELYVDVTEVTNVQYQVLCNERGIVSRCLGTIISLTNPINPAASAGHPALILESAQSVAECHTVVE